jgi:hypothetical protein
VGVGVGAGGGHEAEIRIGHGYRGAQDACGARGGHGCGGVCGEGSGGEEDDRGGMGAGAVNGDLHRANHTEGFLPHTLFGRYLQPARGMGASLLDDVEGDGVFPLSATRGGCGIGQISASPSPISTKNTCEV